MKRLLLNNFRNGKKVFLNVLLQTLRDDNSASFPLYVRKLVEQRANEGYSLKEVEEAFDIYCPLEESLIEVLALIKELFHKFKKVKAIWRSEEFNYYRYSRQWLQASKTPLE